MSQSQQNRLKLLANAIYKKPSKRYLTYIFSPQWDARRREHLELMDYWCEICNSAPARQCHHWTYERLGNEWPQDLCAVCVRCHHKLHMLVMPPPANDNQQYDLFTKDREDDEAA